MARVLQSLRRVLGLNPSRPAPPAFPRTRDSDFSIFREGDRVVIHGKHTPSLSKPLRKGNKTDTRRGVLEHDAVIDGRVWDVYRAHQGSEYRISLPTLEDYVALTPRLVTPIYGADANLIVSLLDIHVAPPAEGKQPRPLEILESGTGHGSLTLHLARAIQAANSNPPPLPDKSQVRYLQDRPLRPEEEKDATTKAGRGTEQGRQLDDNNDKEDKIQKQWDDWRARRGAIIHTVDVSPKFSIHAEKTIRGFRRGIYAGCVDFYVGHVENWIAEQTKQRGPASSSSLSSTAGGTNILSPFVKRTPTTNSNPFLSYAILDMPSAHLRIPHVAPILKRNGMLVVFMPSITQIGDCVELIRRQRLPFVQDKVVELGAGLSGGRLWDVRFAMKKSRADPSSWNEALSSSSSSSSLPSSPTSDSEDAGIVTPNLEESPASSSDEAAPVREESPTEDTRDSVLVCRPKVGTRIVGGGFVGIWRRIEDISKE